MSENAGVELTRLTADARKIPGTEAARPRRRTRHSGPLRGHNGVLAPWVNFQGHPGLEKGRKRRRSTHQRGDRPPPPEILRSERERALSGHPGPLTLGHCTDAADWAPLRRSWKRRGCRE